MARSNKVLKLEDWPLVQELILSIPTYEGMLRSENLTQMVLRKIKAQFEWQEQVTNFGAFSDDQLIGFLQILKWPYSEQNYSLWNDYLREEFLNQRVLTNLLDYAIELTENDGLRNTAWISCPRNPDSFRWKIIKQSMLGNRNIQIVDEIEPGEIPANPCWVWQPSQKIVRQIVKITKNEPTPTPSP